MRISIMAAENDACRDCTVSTATVKRQRHPIILFDHGYNILLSNGVAPKKGSVALLITIVKMRNHRACQLLAATLILPYCCRL